MRVQTMLLALPLVLMTTPARAETWTCRYDGSWITKKSGETGTFVWNATWDGGGAKWRVSGSYNDNYGNAVIVADCVDKKCWGTWTYTSGSLSGKKYYMGGSYADGAGGENTISGSWGYSATNAADGGPWRAKGICRKN
jgi:hypothetical protein